MEALHPFKHLIHFASLRSTRAIHFRNPSSCFIVRCCSSSSSSAATVATDRAAGRNRCSSSSSTTSTSDREAIRAIRIKKVEELRIKGLEPYAYKWDRTHTANQLQEIYRDLGNGEESNNENDYVSISGRIVARRAFGKLAFFTLRDDSGTIQLYCEKERLSSDQFDQLKTLVDIGDILGARGSIKRTEKGSQLTLTSSSISLKSAIVSLCNLKRLREALALILHYPIGADYTLYLKLLDLCIDLKAIIHGHLIHGHLIKNDFPLNVHLNNKLIIFYSKFGDMEVAHKVFDGMAERNLVSWTALLSGYSKNGDSGEALGVLSAMHREGLKGNQFTYGSALRACTSLLCLNRGRQVQARVQKSRFAGNLFVQSALLDFHSKCGKMEDARRVFDSMLERDLISWNAMIGGYSFQGFDDDAFLMFRLMLREGMLPDCFTFGSILRNSFGGCRVAGLVKVSIIHGFIIQLGYESNNFLSGSLIDAFVKCGNLAGANCLYKNMKNKDTISCTALITGYAREGGSSDDCLELFSEIHRMHGGIDGVMLCSMLNICANSALLNLGRQMHSLALKYQSNHDVALGNSLIDMYSKTGEIEDAKRTFDHMKEKNIISWTSMISAYGMHGHVEDAILLYKNMESQGIYPNDVTFLSLFSACSHTGLTIEGWECFRNMVGKYKMLPRSKHYACMVDLFARGGCLEEAHDLICRGDIKPDASLWGSILGACSMYGNMSLGEVAAKHLFSMKPQESANYAVLANLYALTGLWQRASDVRELMVNRGLLKNPGYSFIQSKSNKRYLVPAG